MSLDAPPAVEELRHGGAEDGQKFPGNFYVVKIPIAGGS